MEISAKKKISIIYFSPSKDNYGRPFGDFPGLFLVLYMCCVYVHICHYKIGITLYIEFRCLFFSFNIKLWGISYIMKLYLEIWWQSTSCGRLFWGIKIISKILVRNNASTSISVYISVSQPQRIDFGGWIILRCGAVLCIVGYSAASLAPTY